MKVAVPTALPAALTAPVTHPEYPAEPVTNRAKDNYLIETQNTLKRYKDRLDAIRAATTPQKDD